MYVGPYEVWLHVAIGSKHEEEEEGQEEEEEVSTGRVMCVIDNYGLVDRSGAVRNVGNGLSD